MRHSLPTECTHRYRQNQIKPTTNNASRSLVTLDSCRRQRLLTVTGGASAGVCTCWNYFPKFSTRGYTAVRIIILSWTVTFPPRLRPHQPALTTTRYSLPISERWISCRTAYSSTCLGPYFTLSRLPIYIRRRSGDKTLRVPRNA